MSRIFGDNDIDTFTNLVVRDTAIFDGRVTFNGEVDVCAEFVGEILVDGTLQGTTFLAPGHEFAGQLTTNLGVDIGDDLVVGGDVMFNGSLNKFCLQHGDSFTQQLNNTQIQLGFNDSCSFPHWITSNHYGGSAINNRIRFWTSDGTQYGVFPTNAVRGLTIENGSIAVDKNLSVSNNAYIEGTTVFGTDTPNAGNFVDMISKKGGTHLITPNGIYTDSPAPGTIALSSYVYDHQVQSKMVHTFTLGTANGPSTEFTFWVSAAITVPFEHTFVVENYSPSAGNLSINMLESGATIPGTPYFGIVYANPQVAAYQNQVNISLRGKTGGNPVGRTILRVTYAPTASASFGKSILYIEVLV